MKIAKKESKKFNPVVCWIVVAILVLIVILFPILIPIGVGISIVVAGLSHKEPAVNAGRSVVNSRGV